jgi:hypothetical protein
MRLSSRFPEHVGVRGRDGPKDVSTVQMKGGAYVDRYWVIGKHDGSGWVATARVSMLAVGSFRCIEYKNF